MIQKLATGLILGALSLGVSMAHANQKTLILSCPAPLHGEISSLSVYADVKSYSDAAELVLTMVDGTQTLSQITKEDVVEGYIVLPDADINTERVLLLDEDGWFVALMPKTSKAISYISTRCFEL